MRKPQRAQATKLARRSAFILQRSENFCARHVRSSRGTQLLNEKKDKNQPKKVFFLRL